MREFVKVGNNIIDFESMTCWDGGAPYILVKVDRVWYQQISDNTSYMLCVETCEFIDEAYTNWINSRVEEVLLGR